MSARKFLRVELAPTTLSHPVCVGCGRFNVDFVIVTADGSDGDAPAGIHKKCIKSVKVKRGTS